MSNEKDELERVRKRSKKGKEEIFKQTERLLDNFSKNGKIGTKVKGSVRQYAIKPKREKGILHNPRKLAITGIVVTIVVAIIGYAITILGWSK